jgi:hypothetical protein
LGKQTNSQNLCPTTSFPKNTTNKLFMQKIQVVATSLAKPLIKGIIPASQKY